MLKDQVMMEELQAHYENVEKDMEDCHAYYFFGTHKITKIHSEIKIEKEPVNEDADTLEHPISDRAAGAEDWFLLDYLCVDNENLVLT